MKKSPAERRNSIQPCPDRLQRTQARTLLGQELSSDEPRRHRSPAALKPPLPPCQRDEADLDNLESGTPLFFNQSRLNISHNKSHTRMRSELVFVEASCIYIYIPNSKALPYCLVRININFCCGKLSVPYTKIHHPLVFILSVFYFIISTISVNVVTRLNHYLTLFTLHLFSQ